VTELEALLTAHAYLQVERPPVLWDPETDLEPLIRLLGEMISAALVRNGRLLSQVTLNVSNVTVDPDAAGRIPAGDFVAVTIRSRGDWSPETSWRRGADEAVPLVDENIGAAAAAAGVVYGYSRVLAGGEGSVTVLFARSPG
jgi:hypothetical protein